MHLIQAMHAVGGFLGDAFHGGEAPGIPRLVDCQLGLDRSEQDGFFFGSRRAGSPMRLFQRVRPGAAGAWHRRRRPESCWSNRHRHSKMRCVSPSIPSAIRLDREQPAYHPQRWQRQRDPGREDVARGQRTSAPSAFSVSIKSTAVWMVMCNEPVMRAPLSGCVLENSARDGHQAGHFSFGDGDFFAAPRGQGDVGDNVVFCRHKALHSG